MKNYRLVISYSADGTRYGKKARATLYKGHDKESLKQAIHDYHKGPRKPWSETTTYYDSRVIYAYEL